MACETSEYAPKISATLAITAASVANNTMGSNKGSGTRLKNRFPFSTVSPLNRNAHCPA